MQQIIDLHIHSRFARACSKYITLQRIDEFCRIKGVDIISTGDFTHPAWIAEIKRDLEPHHEGLFKLKGSDGKVSFCLATEISCIYKQGDKVRRIHVCIATPTLESVEQLIVALEDRGCNLRADGRPIIGLSVEELTKICLDIEPRMFVWPAHIWTPWFAMFGSKSGFDRVEGCFGEVTDQIFAIETGLSSDPPMNWRVSQLDRYSIISTSDAHSVENIAREATVIDVDEISYTSMVEAIKSNQKDKLVKTIEFFPDEGMYHIDGHRDCDFSCMPTETDSFDGICPVCDKKLTKGVMYRVNQLADRPVDYWDDARTPFVTLVGLEKIIAESFGIKSVKSKKVQTEYHRMIQEYGSELQILMNLDLKKVQGETSHIILEAINRVRNQSVTCSPGFDGQYGKVHIFSEAEKFDLGIIKKKK